MTTTPPPPDGLPRHPGTPANEGTASTVEQPGSITTAVRLMWAGAATSAVGLASIFATLDTAKEQVRETMAESDPAASQSTIDLAITVSIGVAVVFGLAGVALWLWMAWKNGEGRSWARIVATVLAVLNIMSGLMTGAFGATTAASLLLTLISVALAIVIMAFLWRKESSDFYAARSATPLR